MSDSKSVHLATITDGSFNAEVLSSPVLTVVDFWAEWCGPCKLLTPTVEKIAEELTGKVKIFKMNVDENQGTPINYAIRGIPTLIFFKNGKEVDRMVGNQPKDAILQTIQKNI